MVQLSRFLDEVRAIREERPAYRTGGTGADGTCDCIGMIMGAMYRNGNVEYPMHSSNYAARYMVEQLSPVLNSGSCFTGMIIFKRRGPGDAGYDLHERYKAGGRYYTGDEDDYYHVGVVTSLDPFEITHCTSGGGVDGIKVDGSTKGWSCGGVLKDVDYRKEGAGVSYKAVVRSKDGNPVKMRKMPQKGALVIGKVAWGTEVEVLEEAEGWCKISLTGNIGYMMSEFLHRIGAEEEQPAEEEKKETMLDVLSEIRDILREMQDLNG